MTQFKTYGCLFLALLSAFNLGAYSYATINCSQEIETHRWILTSMFGLMFLRYFLATYKEGGKP